LADLVASVLHRYLALFDFRYSNRVARSVLTIRTGAKKP
jgi:hypothetical protein